MPSPVIVGTGPAGLFCGYLLALWGLCPILLERGRPAQQRLRDVTAFWETGMLDPASNVQFGEGGAGTFSDGKLNTLVKDKDGRNRFVLETFVRFGAPEHILWDQKPHIGTDLLIGIVSGIREEICRLGGQVRFETCVDALLIENGSLAGFWSGRGAIFLPGWGAGISATAPGDTFQMLQRAGVHMEAKDFAVGFRLEHPQKMIDESQYGLQPGDIHLPPAPYKLATKLQNGRGVYSFCMCPGGYVVNASSEAGRLVVNGMSYSGRNSANANSAIVVSVGEREFDKRDPLSGVRYQRGLEERAFALCGGKIPQQLFGDFRRGRVSTGYGAFASMAKGAADFAPLQELLSAECNEAFLAGMELFGKKIHGFDRDDAILSGIESRTSSPVRICRDERFLQQCGGVVPLRRGRRLRRRHSLRRRRRHACRRTSLSIHLQGGYSFMNREVCIFQDFLTDAHKAQITRTAQDAGFVPHFFTSSQFDEAKACLQHCEVLYAQSPDLLRTAPATLKWYCASSAGVDVYCKK